MGYYAISNRIVLVKILGKPLNLSINQVYAPTSADDEIENFYGDFDDAHNERGSQYIVIVMGVMNAKIGAEQDPTL